MLEHNGIIQHPVSFSSGGHGEGILAGRGVL
jgi:hypothetical protein